MIVEADVADSGTQTHSHPSSLFSPDLKAKINHTIPLRGFIRWKT